jgi:cation-transporting P-type ATPase C
LTALEIIWILTLGLLLEEHITDKARQAIRKIFQVLPQDTYVLLEGVEVEIPVSELQKDATVVVRGDQKIPVDGVVLEGEALVDEAHITGRSQPELHGSNDWVYAGTRVQEGVLYIRAEKLGIDTYLSRISHMVDQAMENRPELEKKADILAARLTRLGISATVVTFLLTGSFSRALSVMLVMTCPCATVLATSTAVAAAIANAARMQILIKGGKYLEQVHTVDSLCFDKTGTLTGDLPEVVDVRTRSPNRDTNRIIGLAASAEMKSKHPIAKALLEEARKRGITPERIATSETLLGRGVRADLDSDTLLIGNRDFLETEGLNVAYFKSRAQRHMTSGHTVLYLAKNGKLQGMIAVANTLRPNVESTLRTLREDGIGLFSIISGDTEPIVKTMAETLRFDDYKAGLLPEEKAEYVDQLRDRGLKTLMVGDGVNDALALSKATVGVAMGTGGSEVAIEASDIALVKSDLADLVALRLISGKTLTIIEQNFWMATFTNVVGIILAASGWLPPVMAGLLHIGHSFGIMVNSGRLLNWEPLNPRIP